MRIRLVALLIALVGTPAVAATCPSYPFTLTNGQVADANQVMANFNSVLNCVDQNVQPVLTLPLSVANGGTGGTTITYPLLVNNLSDLPNTLTARANLGLGAAATQPLSTWLQSANNGSDIASVPTFRTNLGVTATGADTTYMFRASNGSDIASPSTFRTNLGLGGAAVLSVGQAAGTVAAGNDSRFAGPTQNAASCPYTFVASDAGGELYVASGSCSLTIPANASVPYAVGTKLEIVNDCSAGTMTLAITSDTLEWFPSGGTGTRTFAACAIGQATKVTTTKWVLTGVGIS